MKIKNKKMFKIATISMIGAVSFGLSLSPISSVNRFIKPVSAENGTASWSYNSSNKTLTCTDVSNYSNEFIEQTNQTSVVGLGNGQYEITYNVLGYSSGSMQPDMDDLGTYNLVFIMGSYEKLSDDSSPYGIITATPSEVNGLDSTQEYEIYVNVTPTGDMNEQGTGGGDDGSGTVIYYDANYGFYYGDHVVLTVTSVDFTGSDNFDNGTATVHLINDDVQYSTTMSNVSLNPVPTNPSGESYTGEITGYIDESQCSVNYYPLDSVPLNYEVEATPEPPALSALEWYFDTDMGYFTTNPYNDNYYSFSLSTEITSVIYDRVNSTVTAHCTVNAAREGNMPEEYYEKEMTFTYTFESGGLVEDTWRFYNAVCEATVENKEELYFSVDVVSFRQLGWYFDEDLHYYVEEGVEASWNILHAEYRTEGSRNELIFDMQILYDNNYTNDVIQINNPDFDEAPYRGQTTLGTGVNGWSDKLQQRISLDINFVPFGYYANGWSYDPYFNQLVYFNADDIDMQYQLTSASSNEDSYLLTYTCDGDSQSITVTEANYEDQMLTGEVVLVENSDPITVTVSVPQSIIDGGTTSTYDYHICFDGNGATGGSMDDAVFTKNSYSFDYPLPDCGYEKDGYTFDGWATVAVDPVIKFQPDQTSNVPSVTEEKPTYTFYATWKKTNFTITFYPNGGSGTMEPIEVANGAREVVPYCEFDYPGYEFVCWAVGSPTSSMKVTPDGQYSVTVTQDYDLYAVWEATGPVQHEGWWYDDNTHKFRYFDVQVRQELTVNTEVFLLDFGENSADTRGYIVAEAYYDSEVRDPKHLDVRTYTVGVESGNRYISCSVALDGETTEQVKLYPDTIHYNVMKPGLNYAEGYNELWHVTDDYYGTVVDPEEVTFNEITRTFSIIGYAEDPTGEQDLVEYSIQLTDGVINGDDDTQDIRTIEGYCAEFGKRIKLNVRYVEYNSLEEESITEETVAEINTSMDSVELSEDQKYQINQVISNNADKIPDSTGSIIAEALDGTADFISSNEEYAEVQKEIIVFVVETAIEVETNKPSDVGQSIRTDSSLPANAGISIEKEVREFYERQMQELLGGNTYPTRLKTRGNDNNYQINVDISHIENPDDVIPYLEDELDNYGKMTEFIEDSVDNMNTAGRKLRTCSGESMKVEVRKTVIKIKTSSFRDFDKDAADLQFAYDVHDAMMLHLQEVVVTELEKDYKPSGNKEKDDQYQAELEACKDIESFTEIVIEVLRQKYNALTKSDIKQGKFGEKGKGIYWDIFKAWCLDQECPYPITFQELTDSTVDVTTQKARSFELNTKVTDTEVTFVAAFVGGSVAFISLAGVLGYVLKKRSLKGVK